MSSPPHSPTLKNYDYLLKFLLVGDSDVGKEEILEKLDEVARAFATQHLATGTVDSFNRSIYFFIKKTSLFRKKYSNNVSCTVSFIEEALKNDCCLNKLVQSV